jgi:hypothetical protein
MKEKPSNLVRAMMFATYIVALMIIFTRSVSCDRGGESSVDFLSLLASLLSIVA